MQGSGGQAQGCALDMSSGGSFQPLLMAMFMSKNLQQTDTIPKQLKNEIHGNMEQPAINQIVAGPAWLL